MSCAWTAWQNSFGLNDNICVTQFHGAKMHPHPDHASPQPAKAPRISLHLEEGWESSEEAIPHEPSP